jgi:hypothetical protein
MALQILKGYFTVIKEVQGKLTLGS